jgi:rhamnulose-1-phosphate aldolase/alcohol dehydrogenase
VASRQVEELRHVQDLWDDTRAAALDPLGRLVYRSQLLGADPRITNTGGGNTSAKLRMPDPLTGDDVEVLWVKGSGGDLRTARRDSFASFLMARLQVLRGLYEGAADRAPKGAAEDSMVDLLRHATYGLNPTAGSIDTPLHAFIPYRHVDHTHPVAVLAIAASEDQERLTREAFGDEIGWVPWQRPGFDLGLVLAERIRHNPQLKGLVLGQHGLINWADDDRACYRLTLSIVERAAAFIARFDQAARTFGGPRHAALDDQARERLLVRLLPELRGMVSPTHRLLATVEAGPRVLEMVDSVDAPRLAELGTSCPDHFLRTKIKPLFVAWDPHGESFTALRERLAAGLARYRADYVEYYEACKRPDSPPLRDPSPTVILVPGLGLIAWGRTKSESRITAEFYALAIDVMRGAEAISRYRGLPRQEAFDIEYWSLEEAKLKRLPAEKELAREVVVVIGAGSGIGKAAAHRIAREGAHVACADLSADDAQQTAQELLDRHGTGSGAAGTGLASCGPAIGLEVDITRRDSVRSLFERVVMAYGGVDSVIVTAGIFVPPEDDGRIPDDRWQLTYAVNVTGGYLVADEARKIWQAQGLPGSLVLTTSVNGAVAKPGSLAYDTSKAAANHLVRELAIELAPLVRVNGLAPATVVAGSGMFPRQRVIGSLRKYQVPFVDGESTAALREKLAGFYAGRTLMKVPVSLEDQAEVAFLLITRRFGKTTGQILSVDGGLPEAFLR